MSKDSFRAFLLPILLLFESLTSFCSCNTCRRPLPDYELFQHGFDATEFDLYSCPYITGQKAQIFNLNHCSRGVTWFIGEREYDVPDSIDVMRAVGGTDGTVVLSNLRDFYRLIHWPVEIRSEYFRGLMNSNGRYIRMQAALTNGTRFVISTKHANLHAAIFSPFAVSHSLVSSYFRKSIDSLPSTFIGNEKDYIDFIKTFGTHILHRGSWGGYFQRTVTIGPEDTRSDATLANIWETKPYNVTQSDTEVCRHPYNNKIAQFKNSNEKSVKLLIGGDVSGARSKGFDQWWRKVDIISGLVNVHLYPISIVVGSEKGLEVQSAILAYMARAHLDNLIRRMKLLSDVPQAILSEYEYIVGNDTYNKNVIDKLISQMDDEFDRQLVADKYSNAANGVIALNFNVIALTIFVTVFAYFVNL